MVAKILLGLGLLGVTLGIFSGAAHRHSADVEPRGDAPGGHSASWQSGHDGAMSYARQHPQALLDWPVNGYVERCFALAQEAALNSSATDLGEFGRGCESAVIDLLSSPFQAVPPPASAPAPLAPNPPAGVRGVIPAHPLRMHMVVA